MSETKRAKPGRAGDAFGRLSGAAERAPVVGGDATAPRHHGAATPAVDPVRRMTVRWYDQGEVDEIDQMLLRYRRMTGTRVDMARVLRDLVRLAHERDEIAVLLGRRLAQDESPIPAPKR